MLDFYNAYKEKIIQFILYRFQRLIGITKKQLFKNHNHELNIVNLLTKYTFIILKIKKVKSLFKENTNCNSKVCRYWFTFK